MTFNNDKAIYIQIAERLSDEILADQYHEDERIPSVLEYAVLLEVNTNTAVKAYELLAAEGVIYNKRGWATLSLPAPRSRYRRPANASSGKSGCPKWRDRCRCWASLSTK